MQKTLHIGDHVAKLSAAVRAKPGLYLGSTGSRAIPTIVRTVIQTALESAPKGYKGPIEVVARKEEIGIRFDNLAGKFFSPMRFAKALSEAKKPRPWDSLSPAERKRMMRKAREAEFLFSILASDRIEVIETNNNEISKITVENGCIQIRDERRRNRTRTSTEITLRLARNPFGQAGHNEVYVISGDLRDLSLLRPGLITKLKAGSQTELGFCYDRGIESVVFEEAHHRWLIYEGLLRAAADNGRMSFECCICFVHAGVPRIQNWVNYSPTQGGSHLEAIGRALHELLGKGGCRSLPLVMNPDEDKTIHLGHSLVGALHLQTDQPKFRGPTKDVLIGDDVFDFVYKHAKKQFTAQWDDLRSKRAL